jgi:hypothetical protein
MGRRIAEMKAKEGWGAGVISRLAADTITGCQNFRHWKQDGRQSTAAGSVQCSRNRPSSRDVGVSALSRYNALIIASIIADWERRLAACIFARVVRTEMPSRFEHVFETFQQADVA